ncbi:MAG: serine/threonine protein kinase [Planctomycetes bacterium]|nr:serine/threonine protein kinase [Planctomycetota bacterium]
MGLLDRLVGGLFKPAGPAETPFLTEYENFQQLGSGSSGIIYTVKHKPTGELRVIKKMKCATPEALRRLHRELEVCLGMQHENVIKYLAYQQKDGFHWVLAEYFRGATLRQFLRDAIISANSRPPYLTGRDFLMMFLQAAKGLAHVHGKGFLHLDIKPENIMAGGLVRAGGTAAGEKPGGRDTHKIQAEAQGRTRAIKVKILDFGVSIKLGEQVPVGGSLFYVAPEITEGKKVGPEGVAQRSDIYSLGATMYELATGDPPYLPDFFTKKGKNWNHFFKDYESLPKMTRSAYDKEMLDSRKTKEPDYARIPFGDSVRQILKKCLEYSTMKRYSQTFNLLRDLEGLCANL